MTEFKVLETFHSEENGNIYVKDMWYTVRDNELAGHVLKWISRGLVKIGERDSRVSGSGKIE